MDSKLCKLTVLGDYLGTSTRIMAIRYSPNIGRNNQETKKIRDNYINILNSKNAERLVIFSLKYVMPPVLKSNPNTLPLYYILRYSPYFFNQIQNYELNVAALNTGEYIIKTELKSTIISIPAEILSDSITDIIWRPIGNKLLPEDNNEFISNICKKALEKTMTQIMVEGVKAYESRH